MLTYMHAAHVIQFYILTQIVTPITKVNNR